MIAESTPYDPVMMSDPVGETGAATAQVAEIIAGDPFARYLGIELLDLRPGHSRMAMVLRSHMDNFNGLPHGGAIFTLADAAFAAASNARGTVAVALSMTIHYLTSPASGTRLIAEATESRLGRRVAFYDITVASEDGQPVARCQGVVQRSAQAVMRRQGQGAAP